MSDSSKAATQDRSLGDARPLGRSHAWEQITAGPRTIRLLLEGLTRTGTGEAYFRALLRELTDTLRLEYAFIAEIISEQPLRGRTLAARGLGVDLENWEFALGATPCRELFEEPYCCYPEGVRYCFAEDSLFARWNVESFAGVRLIDVTGRFIGWVAVLGREPMRDTALVRTAMRMLAERTSAELSRELADRRLRMAHAEVEARVTERTKELETEIARRIAIESQLRDSKERYELAARGSNDGLWDWNIETGEIYVSERWMQIMGCDRSPDDCNDWLEAIVAEDRQRVEEDLWRHMREETTAFESEYRVRAGGGVERWVSCRGAVIHGPGGRPLRFAGSLTDISRRKKSEVQLVYEATHDHLTGLANRMTFYDRLEHAMAINRRDNDRGFAVLFVDLDRFKLVNDSLGHAAGDSLLCELARRGRDLLRVSDLIARLGGDEFTLLIENIAGHDDAARIATRLLEEFSRPFRVGNHDLYVTASVGIAVSDPRYREAGEIVRDADTAMYRAKQRGGARYEIFDTTMHAHAVQRMELEMDLRRALDRDEFVLAYHPVISMRTGELQGFEALLRWRQPIRGTVMPGEFIHVAEETRLIIPISAWVLSEARRQCAVWARRFTRPMAMSVNLSPRQLDDPDLLMRLEDLRSESESPWRFRFEITEGAVIEDAEGALLTFRRIRDLGFELCLDDFGTGYSSLSYLVTMPIATLKIDRSFVASMERSRDSEEMVRTIITLAHNLGLTTVAEGVETSGQLRRLIALGCDHAQGFLFGEPLAPSEAERLLDSPCRFAELIRSNGSPSS